jgi:hypothetical protein
LLCQLVARHDQTMITKILQRITCFISTKSEITRDYAAPLRARAACQSEHGPHGHHAPLKSSALPYGVPIIHYLRARQTEKQGRRG